MRKLPNAAVPRWYLIDLAVELSIGDDNILWSEDRYHCKKIWQTRN